MAHPHGISGLVGKLVTESEVNCNADKYYKIYKHHEDLSSAIPRHYYSVKTVEGDGTSSGCIKEWRYIIEGKHLTVKEKTAYDDEARTIIHSVTEGVLLDKYKKFNVTVVATPKSNGHGSIVKWIIDYEKINEDSPVPFAYLAHYHQIIEDLDAYLCASE